MSDRVQISTGCRLHFGPLAVGAKEGRSFGGIGLTLEQPRIVLQVGPADQDEVNAPADCRNTVLQTISSVRSAMGRLAPTAIDVEVSESIPRHFGLGSGTQLALATAQAMCVGQVTSATQLARWAGRGARSAIGIHGFESGGFLVDAGKTDGDALGTLAARATFPTDWPILLWLPGGPGGLSGDAERQVFAQMVPMESAVTDRLCAIVLRELMPALADHNWREFSRGLSSYGELVGSHFAEIQGGLWSHANSADVVSWLKQRGIEGVAQSSWGPALAAVLPDREMGEAIVRDWPFDNGEVLLTRARNRGADVVPMARTTSVEA